MAWQVRMRYTENIGISHPNAIFGSRAQRAGFWQRKLFPFTNFWPIEKKMKTLEDIWHRNFAIWIQISLWSEPRILSRLWSDHSSIWSEAIHNCPHWDSGCVTRLCITNPHSKHNWSTMHRTCWASFKLQTNGRAFEQCVLNADNSYNIK